jgi:hypothetical protein
VCQRFIEYVAGRGMEEEIRMEGESERLELAPLPRGGFRGVGEAEQESSVGRQPISISISISGYVSFLSFSVSTL